MKRVLQNTVLVIISVLLTLAMLEIAARVYKGNYRNHNYLEKQRDLFRSAYPADFDRQLGWIPRIGAYHSKWNTDITILEGNIRSNGSRTDIDGPPTIVTVGDSFTFGDQVSDAESWPAQLQEFSGARVINGGVFGYGIDQSYLRMLRLAEQFHPDIIVYSFILDDINRAEMSERTAVAKPYFDIAENGDLVLMDSHMPSEMPPPPTLDPVRKVLGYSYLLHKLMRKAFPHYWLEGSWRTTKVHTKGMEVACGIFKKMNEYAVKENISIYVLVQYGQYDLAMQRDANQKGTACIDRQAIRVVDLYGPLSDLRQRDQQEFKSLFQGHMTKAGNAFVARLLLDELEELAAKDSETGRSVGRLSGGGTAPAEPEPR